MSTAFCTLSCPRCSFFRDPRKTIINTNEIDPCEDASSDTKAAYFLPWGEYIGRLPRPGLLERPFWVDFELIYEVKIQAFLHSFQYVGLQHDRSISLLFTCFRASLFWVMSFCFVFCSLFSCAFSMIFCTFAARHSNTLQGTFI